MSILTSVLDIFRSSPVSAAEIRAEAFALGGRHQGEVLAGARSELSAASLPVRRAVLLKAVIRDYA